MQSQIFGVAEPLVTKKVIMEALNITEGTLNYWSRMFPDFPLVRLPGSTRYARWICLPWNQGRPNPSYSAMLAAASLGVSEATALPIIAHYMKRAGRSPE